MNEDSPAFIAYNQAIEDVKAAIRAETTNADGSEFFSATFINAIARKCSPHVYVNRLAAAPVVDNEVHCWHCGIVLERTELKPRCDECSADCDDEFCNAFGCAPSAAATAAPVEQPLPEHFLCVEPDLQPTVINFLRGFGTDADKAQAERHLRLCLRCQELASAAPVEQSGILMQAISFCNHLAEHVTQELTEQSDNPQRDILNYEDYRKGQIQAAVEIRDRLQQLVPNANEGAR